MAFHQMSFPRESAMVPVVRGMGMYPFPTVTNFFQTT